MDVRSMFSDVIAVHPLDGHRLRIEFEDAVEGLWAVLLTASVYDCPHM